MNIKNLLSSSKTDTDERAVAIAKKRQLPDFVNINIDPCEDFYEFVCDKWTHRTKIERYNDKEENEQKWTRIRHRIHDKLMVNITNNKPRSSESMLNFCFILFLVITFNYLTLFRYMLEIGIDE
jgi:hypothetical protein